MTGHFAPGQHVIVDRQRFTIIRYHGRHVLLQPERHDQGPVWVLPYYTQAAS